MPILSKPLSQKPPGKKRALLISIRHVQRASDLGSLPNLEFAHRDAEELRAALIASHGYPEDDIVLMKDDKSHPKHLWPTHGRILHQIDQLIADAPEDCHFFFYYSGHGLEVEAKDRDRASMRADGQEEEIVPADGKPILDNILHDHLITPLERVKGAKLFALFDCCHSESLLDLRRGNGPNHYSREWKIGPDQLFKVLAIAIFHLLKLSKKCCVEYRDIPSAPGQAVSELFSPPAYNTGMVGVDVICLSACRDGQLAHDDCERGLTFTKCFLNVMAASPGITWTQLRDRLRELVSEIEARYEKTYSKSDGNHKPWTQEPRFNTGSHTDLTQPASQWFC